MLDMARWHALRRHPITFAGDGNARHIAATDKHDVVADVASDFRCLDRPRAPWLGPQALARTIVDLGAANGGRDRTSIAPAMAAGSHRTVSQRDAAAAARSAATWEMVTSRITRPGSYVVREPQIAEAPMAQRSACCRGSRGFGLKPFRRRRRRP